MKQCLCILVTACLLLGLCACSDTTEVESPLKVGFGRVDVTPDYSVGLGGYGDAATRRSTGVADYLFVTCIAITEGEETVLMLTADTLGLGGTNLVSFRSFVSSATGIAQDKIFVGATHSHSAPDLSIGDEQCVKYKGLLFGGAAEAALAALEDRAPATLRATTTDVPGMTFVRHYKMADGSYAGSNFGSFTTTTPVDYATESDPQMVLVQFDRTGDKKDILMMNWQSHPDRSHQIGETLLSASFVGPARSKLEQTSGMLVAYFTGASGNLNPDSRISSHMHNLSWKDYGVALAGYAQDALKDLKSVEGSGIQTTRTKLTVEIDHSWDHMVDKANQVYHLWQTESKAAGDALGRTYGFSSSYQARMIRLRSTMFPTEQLEINACRVGGIGFVNGTYEMFSDAGLYIKRNSPYEITFVISGNHTYIPSAAAYDYRSYEADTSLYTKGTAEKLAEEFVSMLKAIQ